MLTFILSVKLQKNTIPTGIFIWVHALLNEIFTKYTHLLSH